MAYTHYIYMKKKSSKWIFPTCCVLSLSLSVPTALMVFFHQSVSWSFLDVASSFIAMAIAAFVMAQIYQSFTLMSRIDKKNKGLLDKVNEAHERQKAEMTDLFKAKLVSYDHNMSACILQMEAVCVSFIHNDFKNALEGLMNALNEANIAKENDFPEIPNPAEGILSFITAIKNINPPIDISEEKAKGYCKILAATGSDEAIGLIAYIQNMSNTAASSTSNSTAAKNIPMMK